MFHDDQHGTAIISGAALLNAVEVAGKKLGEIRVVVSGAGASAMACSAFYLTLGVRPEPIVMLVDSKGVLYKGRKEGMNPYKERFAVETRLPHAGRRDEGRRRVPGLQHAGAGDTGHGPLDGQGPDRVRAGQSRSGDRYPDAVAARDDVIMATGRSDYPNQVNNVLGFPFIFRGALDVRARAINEKMKMAAARALAELAREEVPESVSRAYGGKHFSFGREYIIPKPFDPRVLFWVAPAVAKAAMEEGVARKEVNLALYRESLQERVSRSYEVMRVAASKARKSLKRIVFPEATTRRSSTRLAN